MTYTETRTPAAGQDLQDSPPQPRKPEAPVRMAAAGRVAVLPPDDCMGADFGRSPVPPELKAAQEAEANRKKHKAGSPPLETEFDD